MERDLELLRQLGGLHDARIEEIVWRKADRSLRLTIQHMVSNVDGPAGFDGPAAGSVTLIGVENAEVETGLFRGVFVVSVLEVNPRAGGLDVRVGLREPGADIRLRCKDLTVSVAGLKR